MTIKGTFPNQVEQERIKTIGKYELLYENEQRAVFDLHQTIKDQYKNVADILYLAHAVPAKISDFYGDFVQGDVNKLIIDTTGEDEDEKKLLREMVADNDLAESVQDFATNQSEFGYEVLLGFVKDRSFVIQSVGKDQYFPQRDGSVIFATLIRDPEAAANVRIEDRQKFLYTQHYRLESGKVQILRQAWTLNAEGRAADEVPLSRVGIDETEAPPEETLNIDVLPIVQIDNGRRNRWGFGKSDYHDIIPQLQEMNERATHVATAFIKNLDAILETPAGARVTDEKTGEPQKVSWIEIEDKETPRSQFVQFSVEGIESAQKWLESKIQFISWVSGVPAFELTSQARPERVESMRIRFFSAIRKTETKRAKMTRGIADILKVGFKLLGRELKSDIYVEYSDVVPENELQNVQMEEIKVRAGLTSRFSSMKRLDNLDDTEAAAEMERIQEEDIRSGAVNPNSPPTLDDNS